MVQHDAADSPGPLAGLFAELGVAVELVAVHRGDPVSRDLGAADALLILGGAASANDLPGEVRLIQSALAAGAPVLGLCLGAQLLALALGGEVRPMPRAEIGWHPVTLTTAAASDELWRGLPAEFAAFHWHSDTFDLPAGAELLASSAPCVNQAFRHGLNAYGVQFHLEVDAAKVGAMARDCPGELAGAGLTAAGVVAETEGHLRRTGPVRDEVVRRWVRLSSGG